MIKLINKIKLYIRTTKIQKAISIVLDEEDILIGRIEKEYNKDNLQHATDLQKANVLLYDYSKSLCEELKLKK